MAHDELRNAFESAVASLTLAKTGQAHAAYEPYSACAKSILSGDLTTNPLATEVIATMLHAGHAMLKSDECPDRAQVAAAWMRMCREYWFHLWRDGTWEWATSGRFLTRFTPCSGGPDRIGLLQWDIEDRFQVEASAEDRADWCLLQKGEPKSVDLTFAQLAAALRTQKNRSSCKIRYGTAGRWVGYDVVCRGFLKLGEIARAWE